VGWEEFDGVGLSRVFDPSVGTEKEWFAACHRTVKSYGL